MRLDADKIIAKERRTSPGRAGTERASGARSIQCKPYNKAGMLTPNITTIYAMSFWNIDKQGALVVEVPSGLTAGGILDIWQRPVTDIGQTGPDKGQGGKYLVLGPTILNNGCCGFYLRNSPLRSPSAKPTSVLRPGRAEGHPSVE